MRVHVLYEFTAGPWGGANQFLKAVRQHLRTRGVYAESPEEADVILFNSHHQLLEAMHLKASHPEKAFVHRIDGPIHSIRGRNLSVDRLIYAANHLLAEGTIFQSAWSLAENKKKGMQDNLHEVTILNAPNPNLFNHQGKKAFSKTRKTRIIATSWSDNWRKGFAHYQYLDEHLDFGEFEMTFIGNSPVDFKNVKKLEPLPTEAVAKELKKHDIFITASVNDPCSNSLIEAIHCGLVPIGFASGGHPEIIGNMGEVFSTAGELVEKVDEVRNNYASYTPSLPSLEKIGDEYIAFCMSVLNDKRRKRIDWRGTIMLRGRACVSKVMGVLRR